MKTTPRTRTEQGASRRCKFELQHGGHARYNHTATAPHCCSLTPLTSDPFDASSKQVRIDHAFMMAEDSLEDYDSRKFRCHPFYGTRPCTWGGTRAAEATTLPETYNYKHGC
mmetsp:Transcript_23266/g.71299  ORF Transcript_23266/g.71299 Transcript_23266/m.71299 type:complete len:112 (+) Transcript_23266:240-575(+)